VPCAARQRHRAAHDGRERVVRQPIYYPYAWALAHAKGDVLQLAVESPSYDVASVGAVPFVDVAATIDRANGDTSLFLLNRDLDKPRELKVVWHDGPRPASEMTFELPPRSSSVVRLSRRA